jgi:hypothetical protein
MVCNYSKSYVSLPTHICSSAIIQDTLRNVSNIPDSLVIFYYFSFSDAEKQKASNLLRSLLSQLAAQKGTALPKIETLYNGYQQKQLTVEVLKTTLRSTLEVFGDIFLIIDALDECPNYDNERQELCTLLTEFSTWGLSNLHVLVTSRKERDIEEALAEIPTIVAIPIQNDLVDTDVRLHELRKWSQNLKEEIETVLVTGANGMLVTKAML